MTRGPGVGRINRRLAVASACGVAALAAAAMPGSVLARSRTAATWTAHGSVEQVYALGLRPRQRMTLVDSRGRNVATKRADGLGGLLFRHVRPGRGYRLRPASGGRASAPLRVLSTRPAPPSTRIYDQRIPPSGYGYLETRDGTKLAIDVHPPQDVTTALPGIKPPEIPAGPTPTLIEYSGYGYADPSGPQNGISILANLMGFTVVDVNMRGTGCSGGAFDFFEPLQNLDGYDVIETIARQPWVLHRRVGMMGISYGGISQLFTAQTDPPHLAAISPLSVIDSTQSTLYPGGILNTGFALNWARERVHDARPASPDSGQHWAWERIRQGDRTCRENQALHPEAANLLQTIRDNNHYHPKVADPVAPITFVHKIHVPVFLACQFTDEQTGGHCPDLAEHFTGTRRKWFTFTNGTHVDSLDPETFDRWYDFLQLFVARRPPLLFSAAIQAAAPVIYQEAMGVPGQTMPPDPVQLQPTYSSALRLFERQPPVRVMFDNGAGGLRPGMPDPGYTDTFPRFPAPGTVARSWFLAPDGTLSGAPPAAPHADSFNWNPHALPHTNFHGDTSSGRNGLWTATPGYEWLQHPEGTAVSYLTPPLPQDTTVVGAGALHLWVRSSTPDVDLQATITEVRPDGKETFVQNGWVRAAERKLNRRKSTPLEPVLGLRRSAVSPLPAHRFVRVTIPLYYEGHAYRRGSRIRVTIAAPNGDQPIWSFSRTHPRGRSQVAIAYSRRMPSRLTLPVEPAVDIPTPLPPCPGMRGEPCRDYRPLTNRPARP